MTRGVPLFTAYYRRAHAALRRGQARSSTTARSARIRAASIRIFRRPRGRAGALPWRVDPPIAGGGLFVDLASHTLDLLDYFVGPLVEVAGGAANQGGHYAAEDLVSAAFTFAGGARGTGLWASAPSGNTDRTELVGTRGRITYATFGDPPVRLETEAGDADADRSRFPPTCSSR